MAAPRSAAPAPNLAPLLGVAAVVLGIAAAVFRLPGGIVAWVVLMVAAWMSTPPQLTGKKDAAGYPTVGNPGEGKKHRQHQKWSFLRWRLVASSDLLLNEPAALNKKLQDAQGFTKKVVAAASWLFIPSTLITWFAVGAAAAVATMPVDGFAIIGWDFGDLGTWLMWPNAAAIYIIIKQFDAASRRFAAPSDPKPAITVADIFASTKTKQLPAPVAIVAPLVTAGAVAAAVTVALLGFNFDWLFVPWQLTAAGLGVCAASLVGFRLALPHALDSWRQTVDAREKWDNRWPTLKVDPIPHLTEHKELKVDGDIPVVVDTFDAPSHLGAEGIINMLPKMAPIIGGGARLMMLNEPDTDSSGQPVLGSRSPIKFSFVVWPNESTLNIHDPNVDQDTLAVLLRAASTHETFRETSCHPPMLLGVERVNVDKEGARAVWKTTWMPAPHGGGALSHVGKQIEALFDTEAIPDMGEGAIYVGALSDEETEFTDPNLEKRFIQIAREARWRQRWTDVLKMGEVQPWIQHDVYEEISMPDGSVIFTQPFMTGQGIESSAYATSEKEMKLTTALERAPFVSIQYWAGRGARAGERDRGAFRVVWSPNIIRNNPALLAPAHGKASQAIQWIISALINDGFDAAGFARAEVMSAVPLTSRKSEKHIWDVELRLYGKTTLSAIKQNIDKIRNGMGAIPWIRVTTGKEGARLVIGAQPAEVDFSNEQNRDLCAALDWEQAFTVAKVMTSMGQVPVLVSNESLPKNPKVRRLTFQIPPGLDRSSVRNAKKVLATSTGNVYLEDEAGPTPDTVSLVVCHEQPVPFPAPFDWDEVMASNAIPFASGVTGEPIVFDWKLDPHLLLLGGSGSGKSASLQNLITGALIRGCEVYVADPTKAAADFMYAKPWAKAIAITDGEASAMMDHIYAEVTRRKLLNSQYAVASYADLPEDVRPPHIVVVIDEFTSLMFTDTIAKLPVSASEEEVMMHQEQELANTNRRNIGGKTGRIVREARSAGVTLILAAQELKADTIQKIPGGTSLKGNMSSILLGKTSFGSRMSALKDAVAAPELGDDVPKGRGLFESTASSAQVIQSWFDAPDHVLSMTQHISAVCEPLSEEQRIDLSALVKHVEDTPVFGRRIDSGEELFEDDEELIDLGVVEIDFGDVFANPDMAPAPERTTMIFAGPACPDDSAPDGSFDVDVLPPASTAFTGETLVDTILSAILGHSPLPTSVQWVSPAAFTLSEDGRERWQVLESAAEMFGVTEVIPSMPAQPDAPAAEPLPAAATPTALPEPATVALPEPTPDVAPTVFENPEPAAQPTPAQIQLPDLELAPPPDSTPEVEEMFGAPRRVIAHGEGF